eukprot:GHUV01010488.1.p2 GENE.GHUV01010488.1~~GHUV01010488.1.p2  ORF type:complete len:126 (+),score=6.59 GHUV01010488.1:878-1255(+)
MPCTIAGSLGLKPDNEKGTVRLDPSNWIRWGYACLVGVVLFGAYGITEYFYNRKHGSPPPRHADSPFVEGMAPEHDACSGDDIIDELPVTCPYVEDKGCKAGVIGAGGVDGHARTEKDVSAVEQA